MGRHLGGQSLDERVDRHAPLDVAPAGVDAGGVVGFIVASPITAALTTYGTVALLSLLAFTAVVLLLARVLPNRKDAL